MKKSILDSPVKLPVITRKQLQFTIAGTNWIEPPDNDFINSKLIIKPMNWIEPPSNDLTEMPTYMSDWIEPPNQDFIG